MALASRVKLVSSQLSFFYSRHESRPVSDWLAFPAPLTRDCHLGQCQAQAWSPSALVPVRQGGLIWLCWCQGLGEGYICRAWMAGHRRAWGQMILFSGPSLRPWPVGEEGVLGMASSRSEKGRVKQGGVGLKVQQKESR